MPPAEVTFDYPGDFHGYSDIRSLQSGVIDKAEPGSLIVVSVFRMTDASFADDLLDAADRGVHVEVLLDGGNNCTAESGCPSPPVRELENLYAPDRDPLTWLRTCDGGTPANGEVATSSGRGCIGQGLNHNKFMALSQTSLDGGPDSNLVLQTSSNNTGPQYRHAWNDALLVSAEPAAYQDYLGYFRRMVSASTSSAPTSTMYFTSRNGSNVDTSTIGQHDIETWSFPRAPNDDPVADVLGKIPTAHRCRNRVGSGTSGPTHTHVYAAVAFIGGRPLLMKRLVALQEAGCPVQVLYTSISAHDRAELSAGGVQIHQACTPADPADSETAQYLHSKFFLVEGSDTTVGTNRRIVYTGSENWNGQSLSSADNRMLRYVEAADEKPVDKAAPNSPLFDSYLQRWLQIDQTIDANGQPTADKCKGASDY